MARRYGKLYVDIWRDPDFNKLTGGAQRLYMFLMSQPDLNSAGVLTMALNRWATRASDTSREDMTQFLYELSKHKFVVVDETCEEVLIRSYIRRDEGWKSPNVIRGIVQTAANVMSETLRAVISDELGKINTSDLSAKINERTGRSTKQVVEETIAWGRKMFQDCTKDPSVVAWAPHATQLDGFPSIPIASQSQPVDGFDLFWETYPRKVRKREALEAWRAALNRASEQRILAGVKAYAADPNLPPEAFVPTPTKWLRGDSWDDGPQPPRNDPSQPKDTSQGWELVDVEGIE